MPIDTRIGKINKYNNRNMATYHLKRKCFTQWDDTDNLKRMKDSDILAEQKRPTSNTGAVIRSAATGAGLGATVGATAGSLAAIKKSGPTLKAGFKGGLKGGAIIGAGLAATSAYLAGRKQAKENRFYNNRLAYAQRQAGRRERKDWKNNMTNREGYSY